MNLVEAIPGAEGPAPFHPTKQWTRDKGSPSHSWELYVCSSTADTPPPPLPQRGGGEQAAKPGGSGQSLGGGISAYMIITGWSCLKIHWSSKNIFDWCCLKEIYFKTLVKRLEKYLNNALHPGVLLCNPLRNPIGEWQVLFERFLKSLPDHPEVFFYLENIFQNVSDNIYKSEIFSHERRKKGLFSLLYETRRELLKNKHLSQVPTGSNYVHISNYAKGRPQMFTCNGRFHFANSNHVMLNIKKCMHAENIHIATNGTCVTGMTEKLRMLHNL